MPGVMGVVTDEDEGGRVVAGKGTGMQNQSGSEAREREG